MDHLLPRLLPRGERGYLFASYISDQKEVVKRYIDVGKEGEYMLAGKTIHAVPVSDRIGLEGSVTTHYVTPEGEYLGTANPDSKITLIPTDAATFRRCGRKRTSLGRGMLRFRASIPTRRSDRLLQRIAPFDR